MQFPAYLGVGVVAMAVAVYGWKNWRSPEAVRDNPNFVPRTEMLLVGVGIFSVLTLIRAAVVAFG